MLLALETLGVDFVDVLGAGGPGGEPSCVAMPRQIRYWKYFAHRVSLLRISSSLAAFRLVESVKVRSDGRIRTRAICAPPLPGNFRIEVVGTSLLSPSDDISTTPLRRSNCRVTCAMH